MVCRLPLTSPPPNYDHPTLSLLYLCKHPLHATCALPDPDIELPPKPEGAGLSHLLVSGEKGRGGTRERERELGGRLSYAAAVRVRVGRCPVCERGKGVGVKAG